MSKYLDKFINIDLKTFPLFILAIICVENISDIIIQIFIKLCFSTVISLIINISIRIKP